MKPVKEEEKQIGCLRCRHAKALPHTDWNAVLQVDKYGKVRLKNDATVPIWCEKIKRARPAFLEPGCPYADARPQWVKGQRCGDATTRASRLELVFLKTVWEKCSPFDVDTVLRWIERTRETTVSLAYKRSLRRPRTRDSILVLQIKKQANQTQNPRYFSPAQDKFLKRRQQEGPWPAPGGNRFKGPFWQEQQLIKAEIVAEVARLGSAKTWEQINRHLYNLSPAAQRADRKRNPRKFLK